MTTIRITLPNNIIVETDFTSAMAIINGYNSNTATPKQDRVEQIKANNALLLHS